MITIEEQIKVFKKDAKRHMIQFDLLVWIKKYLSRDRLWTLHQVEQAVHNNPEIFPMGLLVKAAQLHYNTAYQKIDHKKRFFS